MIGPTDASSLSARGTRNGKRRGTGGRERAMAGEAVSGRYGARHAVADETEGRAGGPQRRPASDDRSLVDRLLAGNGNDRGYDWGWGDPATGELVTDREPLHDIPELWGAQEDRASRGDGDERAEDDDGGDFADRAGLDRAVGESGLAAPGPEERASGDHG